MHADLMRGLDRFIGIPACFVLTLLVRLHRWLGGPPKSSGSPQRILFIGLAEIGALVVAHPALDLARRRFPGAQIYFLTFPAGVPMLRLMGLPDTNILTLDPSSAGRLAASTLSAVRRMRRIGVDATISLEIYVRFSAILAVLSGARRRAGFHRFHEEGHYLGELSTHRLVYSPHRHAAQAYMALVHALVEPPGSDPRAKVPAEPVRRLRLVSGTAERDSVRRKLLARYPGHGAADLLVILNANAGDLVAQRRWPIENYTELGRRLLERPEVVIVLTGTQAEHSRVDDLAQRIGNPRVANLAGDTSLAELIALFDMAALLVTNDSGPAHFASTTDVPTLALFGPETPRIFGPLGPAQEVIYLDYACSPCVSVYNQKRSPCQDNRCIKDIRVEDVLAAAHRHLASRRSVVGDSAT